MPRPSLVDPAPDIGLGYDAIILEADQDAQNLG
jgi:hypothetical protein